MPKMISFRQGFGSVLLWSVISAAFIGPGTVTTAAQAGASFGFQLLWALTFSTAAAIVLQEAAARITIASGKSLGEIIALQYAQRGRMLCVALFAAVAFGCAAYEAGNIVGAAAGLRSLVPIARPVAALCVALPAALLLWNGRYALIARILGAVVFLMGFAFMYAAATGTASLGDWVKGAVVPTVPAGSLLLITGLIGTTIVPYNLFLAAGIGKGQSVAEMRAGLAPAILIGGLISMAIVAVGAGVVGEFSYAAVAETLRNRLGPAGSVLFGFGLFAAGATSAITAPLAAAMTAQGLLGNRSGWKPAHFRWVWGIVLGTGLVFGLLNVKPIPAIILAQAINGLLLPLVTAFLLLAVNDRKLLPEQYANGLVANVLSLVVFAVVCWLGIQNLWKSVSGVLPGIGAEMPWWAQMFLSAAPTAILGWRVMRQGEKSLYRE